MIWGLTAPRNGFSGKINVNISNSDETNGEKTNCDYDAEQEKGLTRFSGESKNLPLIRSKPLISHH